MASSDPSEVLRTDYLVLGSGVAGLRSALSLARSGRVLVVTKDQPSESNTGYAQGGVAVALSPDDEVDLHFHDTLAAGAGISAPSAARVLVDDGPERVRELVGWGARFDREEGRVHFTREAAHSRSRVLHALGDATGWEVVRTLLERARRTEAIEVRSFSCSTDLVTVEGRVAGCRFVADNSRTVVVRSKATLLTTGGLGRVFAETTNPPVATGDGAAMALRAGAALLDMEFVQFHPTALAVPGAPRFLISEAVRGEGAWLLNAKGERFTDELLPRDQVARAIFREQKLGAVSLDLRHLSAERVRTRFPRITAHCLRYGIDITRDLVPVTPAAHYAMGGVFTDLWGRSSLPGLYAAGEAASNGVHGANRLASNSLLEGLVFGARAAEAILQDGLGPGAASAEAAAPASLPPPIDTYALRLLAWEHLGLEREAVGIRKILDLLESLRSVPRPLPGDRAQSEAVSTMDVLWSIARSALFREESRGAHFRLDFPRTDDARFLGHTLLEQGVPRLVGIEPQVPTMAPC